MRVPCLAIVTAFFLAAWSMPASAATSMTEAQAGKTLGVQYSMDRHHVISGKIINETKHAIKDPELLVEYHWLWAKEFRPGNNPPGRAAYVKLNKEIQPGQSVDFTYRPQPALPHRNDGRFVPEVSPAGFTVVLTPQRTASSR